MRILWASDRPSWPTGYGSITRDLCSGLAGLGHEIHIIGGKEGGRPLLRRQFTVYPGDGRNPDAKVLLGYLRKLRPDVLVTLTDLGEARAVTQRAVEEFRRSAGVVWVLFYPLGGDRGRAALPARTISRLKAPDLTVVQSRYGRDVTHASGVSANYIPVGVDTGLFRPPEDKDNAKRALGYEGQFVILCDARNQIRKLLPRTLEIFQRFAVGKDDVRLHLLCDPYDPAARTDDYYYNILSDVELLGLDEKVRFTRGMSICRGPSRARLAALYQAADVHLLTSFGEGFGMPTLQAAAAGVVPLAPAYAANRELVKGHGELIRVRGFVRNEAGWRCAFVDIDDAAGRLERLYQDRSLLKSKAQAARRFAEAYDWEQVVRQWHDLLEREVPRLRAGILRGRATTGGRQRSRREISGNERDLGNRLTIPVTLPSADTSLAQTRVTGRVCLVSPADIPVFQELSCVFPRLSTWSPMKLDLRLKRGRAFQCKTVPTSSSEFRSYLAATTLALDLGCVEGALPVWTVKLAVPSIGLSCNAKQQWLWPDLTLEKPDVSMAAQMGRRMLTDQVDAAKACALARRRSRQRCARSKL